MHHDRRLVNEVLESVPLVGHGLEQLGLGVRGAGVAQPVVQEGGGPLVHVLVSDGPQETNLKLPLSHT